MPVSIFGGVMGLTALSFAWSLADQTWHVGSFPATVIGWAAILAFLTLTVAYLTKWARHPAARSR
ncbi:hypothetical protein ACQ86N_15100 [Puia sp. P3]|uniref:SLAC1 family transporter n=1 Tax=Puia sp. P3 TaxID=3423952 RepID=UPI003D675D18